MGGLSSTLTELSWEFRKVGPDLVHHSPTNLFISTEGRRATILDPLKNDYSGVSKRLEEFKQSQEASMYDILHDDNSKSNFIRVVPTEALLSVFEPVTVAICAGCKKFCCEFSEEESMAMNEHQSEEGCRGAGMLPKQFPGLAFGDGGVLFVVFDWDAKGLEDESVSEPAVQGVEDVQEDQDEEALVSQDENDPVTPASGQDEEDGEDTLVDEHNDFEQIGENLYFHAPTRLFFKYRIPWSGALSKSAVIVDPYGSKQFLQSFMFEKDTKRWSPNAQWSSFYKETRIPQNKNFAIMDPDASLLSLLPLWPLAVCNGCYKFCYAMAYNEESQVSGETPADHLGVCGGKCTGFERWYGIQGWNNHNKTFMLFEEEKLKQLDGLIPGIMDDFSFKLLNVDPDKVPRKPSRTLRRTFPKKRVA